ncbi:MAG: hypothetical protein J6S95_07095 [Lachnospiraceae bacterium]|nr:hypothetical protein [Lachnospiraceae bacterium]
MKRTILKIVASFFVFIVTMILSGYFMNKGNVNTTKNMDMAALPVVYMNVGGNTVNELHGYTMDMDVALLRDSITPLDDNRGASFRVVKHSCVIKSVNVKLRTIEGSRLIESIDITDYEENDFALTASVNFKGLIDEYKEYCMEIYITTGTGVEVMYHTRVTNAPLYCAREKLAFVLDFHDKAGSIATNEELKGYMESNYTGDNTTLAFVNIHSSMSQLAFANLNVYEITKPVATFKELNYETAVFTVDYVAGVRDSKVEKKFFVSEYYRIKYTTEVTYLLDYERTMHEITDDDNFVINDTQLTLGITDYDISLTESEDGSIFAFVNENKLYSYNISENHIARLFSFYDNDNFDARTTYGKHKIKPLSVDEAGNVSFIVYGYMNRGTYEGKVGMTFYEYNGVTNIVEEKFFISSDKSPEMVIHDIDELSYLNKSKVFYFMIDRSIYAIDTESIEVKEMVNDLEENMYTVSNSRSMLVWQSGNNVNSSEKLMVMNLNTGQVNTIAAADDEYIKPLAFMNEDLIYGLAEKSDVVTDAAGRTTFPMYCMKIQNEYGELLKTYEEKGKYITDVSLKENLLTIKRVKKHDGEVLRYDAIDDDYMTNNQPQEENRNTVQTAVDDLYETIVRIKFDYETSGKTVLLTPEQIIYEGSKEIYLSDSASNKKHYYVYYKGKLQTISTKPSNAVMEADQNYGTVLDDEGYYVWYRANRDLRNQIMDLSLETTDEEKNNLAWCMDRMLEYEGVVRNSEYLLGKGETVLTILSEGLEGYDVLNLTGCTLDSILYYVNRDIPVLALTNTDDTYLIIGFNQLAVVLLDPDNSWYKIGRNEAEEMFEESGNQFITYVPNK